jgi:hypothetical protein
MNKLENISPEDLQAIEEIVSKGVSISWHSNAGAF